MWDLKAVDEKEFYEKVLNCKKPVFIDFWAVWCPPCRMMEPLLNDIMNMYKDRVEFIKVNVDINKKIAKDYDIQGVPSYMIIKGKKKIKEIIGASSKKQLADLIEEAIEIINNDREE